jgi:hypothetical protein
MTRGLMDWRTRVISRFGGGGPPIIRVLSSRTGGCVGFFCDLLRLSKEVSVGISAPVRSASIHPSSVFSPGARGGFAVILTAYRQNLEKGLKHIRILHAALIHS